MTDAEKLKAVRQYVLYERKRRKIIPTTERLPELSCEAIGEFFNLVERQLVNTREGYGAWSELKSPEVLDGAYQYITQGHR